MNFSIEASGVSSVRTDVMTASRTAQQEEVVRRSSGGGDDA